MTEGLFSLEERELAQWLIKRRNHFAMSDKSKGAKAIELWLFLARDLLKKQKEEKKIHTIKPCRSSIFHGIECIESEEEFAFYKDERDRRPSSCSWIKKEYAEHLYKILESHFLSLSEPKNSLETSKEAFVATENVSSMVQNLHSSSASVAIPKPLKEDDVYMFHDQEFNCIKVDDVRLAVEWLKIKLCDSPSCKNGGKHGEPDFQCPDCDIIDLAFGEVLE